MALNSLFTGLSGIQVHQIRTNVVADNIANINTNGYKARRANFSELLAQTLKEATGPSAGVAGTNPAQSGTGVRLKSIEANFTQGGIQTTEKTTDLAIEGSGFFILRDKDDNNFYTRDGSFSFDADGRLINPANGMVVQGNSALNGSFDTTAKTQLQDVQIDLHKEIAGTASTIVNLSGNLDPGTVATLDQKTQFTVSGVLATVGTTLNATDQVDSNAGLNLGDTLQFAGTTPDGMTTFDGTLPIAAGTETIGNLLTAIETAYEASDPTGVLAVTVTLDTTGKIQITDDSTSNILTGFTIGINLLDPDNSSALVQSGNADRENHKVAITVFDSEGDAHNMIITFQETGIAKKWDYTVKIDGMTPTDGSRGRASFNPDGSLSDFVPFAVDTNGNLLAAVGGAIVTNPNLAGVNRGAKVTIAIPGGPAALQIDLQGAAEGGITGLTEFASPSTAEVVSQDGRAPGSLESILARADGVIEGRFSNGQTLALARVLLSDFRNPGGLIRKGGNLFAETEASGNRITRLPMLQTSAQIISGAVELSNVDLAAEFVDLIISQRGFQANARVVTTTDQILAETVNLKQ